MGFVESPLNYTGGKYRLLPQIIPLFPANINTFVDLFCGGCNVGVNILCNNVIFNDINGKLISLFNVLKNNDKKIIIDTILEIIGKHKLSLSSRYGYGYYGCESSTGLGSFNRSGFLHLRSDYNENIGDDATYKSLMLYTLIVYSFNNQIRFNARGEFNLPVGKRDFNSRMEEKLSRFIDYIHANSCSFSCIDFRNFDVSSLSKDDFVYIDPPYLITCATYNEQDSWNENLEKDLLCFLDNLNRHGIRFALSNVIRSKGKSNDLLIKWTRDNADKYRVIDLDYSYSNSNYQIKDRDTKSEEVLIVNY